MKLGLVLGGTGLSGFLNLALVEWVQNLNLPISMISASGTGSVVASLWAQGRSVSDIQTLIEEQIEYYAYPKVDLYTFFSFFADWTGQFKIDRALIKSHPLKKKYTEWFGDSLVEDLPVQCILMTTDVTTGRAFPLVTGSLADAVYASSALLPFFPPMQLHGRWLADGSFVEPFPIMELSSRNIDMIFVLYFEEGLGLVSDKKIKFIESYANFLNRSIYKSQRTRMALAVDLHHDEIIFVKINLEESLEYDIGKFRRALDRTRIILEEKMQKMDFSIFKNLSTGG